MSQIKVNILEIKDKIHLIAAFTLAEVLITLGIIGIVAAMTIPTLLNNISESEYKTAYKKAYSALSQALLSARNDGDLVALTGTNSSVGMEANFAIIQNYFIIAKKCDSSNTTKCWATGEMFVTDEPNIDAFIDNAGMSWKLRALDSAGSAPTIFVDTNGLKKPNKFGQDRFPLFFGNSSMSPSNLSVSNLGIPTKIIPLRDILTTSDPSYIISVNVCKSVDVHPCYYSSWILGN